MAAAKHTPIVGLASAPLQRARGTWRRYCPRWWFTGGPAIWSMSEPRAARAAMAKATGGAQ